MFSELCNPFDRSMAQCFQIYTVEAGIAACIKQPQFHAPQERKMRDDRYLNIDMDQVFGNP